MNYNLAKLTSGQGIELPFIAERLSSERAYQKVMRGLIVSIKQADIEQILGKQAARADLIAQDQTIKLVADLNRYRQEQAGIKRYRWVSKQDDRVRPLHQRLNGKIYEWGKPTGAEHGLPPGQPIRCRCRAKAVL